MHLYLSEENVSVEQQDVFEVKGCSTHVTALELLHPQDLWQLVVLIYRITH